jgi:hypothetical protein
MRLSWAGHLAPSPRVAVLALNPRQPAKNPMVPYEYWRVIEPVEPPRGVALHSRPSLVS